MSSRPLSGRRVIVTRGIEKTDRLPGLLEAAGATVDHIPLIARERLTDDLQLRAALSSVRDPSVDGERPWLVLTSEIGAGMVLDAVGARSIEAFDVAVVGPATAAALRSRGVAVNLTAPGQDAGSLAAELTAGGVAGRRVVVIAAAGGRDVIAPALSGAGAVVTVVEAYRSVLPRGAVDRLRVAFAGSPPDAITFTSGSTVRHCTAALGDRQPPGIPAVCIGPVTAQAARDAGWSTVATATEHTAAGLTAAVVACLATAHPLP